ncbi:MAG: hypothetical protein WCJ26_07795 [bacterium]
MKKMKIPYPGMKNPGLIYLLVSFVICQSLIAVSHAQTVSTGTTLVIASGTTVNTDNSMSVLSGGTLDVQGTLVLKKNLTNNSAIASLGPGLIEFSGTVPQTISGVNVIQDLRINNAKGVTIAGTGDTRVNGILKLKNGLLKLGSNNLVLGPSASDSISLTPNLSMVVPTGVGEFRKEFASAGTFKYNVGDSTGTGVAEYSPVTLAFTSGTFGANNYAGVKLVNAKYPNDSITTPYLSRYWALSQSGITAFNCNATFNYVAADVTGTEASLYCNKVDPSPWVAYGAANTSSHYLTANNLSSFSTFTGSRPAMDVGLTAFLEGPYSGSTMTTALRTAGLVPLSQPYNVAPWNYNGPESVASIPAGVVDWVLIELRQAATPATATSATILKRRAAFIKSDGTIVEKDGTSPVRFYNAALTSNLYPVVKHRNHLAIMANNAVGMTSGIYTYNLSSGTGQIYGTGKVQLGSLWGMIAANADGSDFINNDDLLLWQSNFSQANYNKADFDFTGFVNNDDLLKWQQNFSKQATVPN